MRKILLNIVTVIAVLSTLVSCTEDGGATDNSGWHFLWCFIVLLALMKAGVK